MIEIINQFNELAIRHQQEEINRTVYLRIFELEDKIKQLTNHLNSIVDFMAKNEFFYLDDHK